MRSNRVSRYVPQDSVGLRLVVTKLKARKQKEADSKKKADKLALDVAAAAGQVKKEEVKIEEDDQANSSQAEVDAPTGDAETHKEQTDVTDGVKEQDMSVKDETETEADAQKIQVDGASSAEKPQSEDVSTEKPQTGEATDKDQLKAEEEKPSNMDVDDDDDDEDFKRPVEDVINVTMALINRTHYVKVTKPYSRLDNLLEKRMRQYETEQKQKTLFERIILRYRKQEALKKQEILQQMKQVQQKVKVEKMEKEAVMEVDFKDETAKNRTKSPYQCYSATCPCRKKEGESKVKEGLCYSITCAAFDEDEEDESEDEEVRVDEDDKDEKVRLEDEDDEEDEDMDVDVVGDKEKNSPLKPPPKAAPKPPTSQGATASVMTTPSSGIISLQSLAKGGKIQLTAQLVKDIETRLELVGNTKAQVTLFKNTRYRGKSKLASRKGNLPPGHKFVSKSKKRNIFILEKHEVRTMARKCGFWESKCFNYNCKMTNVNWPYPCPRPLFKTSWRYRTQCISNLSAAGVQLRVMWAVLRWDDLNIKPPGGNTHTVTTETEITTTELLRRRDVGVHGHKSEFLVRKLIVPIGVPSQPRGN